MDYLSYDSLLAHIIDLRTQEQDKSWELAAAYAVALETYKAKPGDIASQVGCSARHIKNLANLYLAFPSEEDRNKELSISHHMACLGTDNPIAWLERAEAEQMSVRALKMEMQGRVVRDEEKDAARAWGKVMQILEGGGPGAIYLRGKIHEAGLGM